MISEFYIFLAVVGVAIVLMAVVIIAIFVEMKKSHQNAGEPSD
jgi:hypothetical protein